MLAGGRVPFRCSYRCLATCEPAKSPYCIAQALVNAYRGNMDEGFATCGVNASRITRIVSVQELMDELVDECRRHLKPVEPSVSALEASGARRDF